MKVSEVRKHDSYFGISRLRVQASIANRHKTVMASHPLGPL